MLLEHCNCAFTVIYTENDKRFTVLTADKGIHIFHANFIVRQYAQRLGKLAWLVVDSHRNDTGEGSRQTCCL